MLVILPSVCGGYARCLFTWPWDTSVIHIKMVDEDHHQNVKCPRQVVEIRVVVMMMMMNLILASTELRLCSSVCRPTVSDVCQRAN